MVHCRGIHTARQCGPDQWKEHTNKWISKLCYFPGRRKTRNYAVDAERSAPVSCVAPFSPLAPGCRNGARAGSNSSQTKNCYTEYDEMDAKSIGQVSQLPEPRFRGKVGLLPTRVQANKNAIQTQYRSLTAHTLACTQMLRITFILWFMKH